MEPGCFDYSSVTDWMAPGQAACKVYTAATDRCRSPVRCQRTRLVGNSPAAWVTPHEELQLRCLSLYISEGHDNTSSRGGHTYNKYLQWKWVCAAIPPTLTSVVIDTMSMEISLVLPGESRIGSANAGTLPLARNCCETTNWDGMTRLTPRLTASLEDVGCILNTRLPKSRRIFEDDTSQRPVLRTVNYVFSCKIQFEDYYMATMEIVMNVVHLQNHKVPMIPRLT